MKFKKLLPSAALPLLLCGAILSGCENGRVVDISPPQCQQFASKYSSINVQSSSSTITVPEEVNAQFKNSLENYLIEEVEFKRGCDLTISYRFISVNEGNQLVRWFMKGLGSAGRGDMVIEATYINQAGQVIAKIRSESEISTGIFGGSFRCAIDRAAKEIANHARQFKR